MLLLATAFAETSVAEHLDGIAFVHQAPSDEGVGFSSRKLKDFVSFPMTASQ